MKIDTEQFKWKVGQTVYILNHGAACINRDIIEKIEFIIEQYKEDEILIYLTGNRNFPIEAFEQYYSDTKRGAIELGKQNFENGIAKVLKYLDSCHSILCHTSYNENDVQKQKVKFYKNIEKLKKELTEEEIQDKIEYNKPKEDDNKRFVIAKRISRYDENIDAYIVTKWEYDYDHIYSSAEIGEALYHKRKSEKANEQYQCFEIKNGVLPRNNL